MFHIKRSKMCSGQRKLEQLANPVISQRSGEIPVTRLGPSPAQTVFHAWFQGFFTPFRMTNVQTTLDPYNLLLFPSKPYRRSPKFKGEK